jgi:hypothetical protein
MPSALVSDVTLSRGVQPAYRRSVRQRLLLLARRLRAASLLLALLSAVGFGGAQEAACAMHGLGAAHAGAGVASHVTTVRMTHESGDHEHGRGTSGCDCTCIGDCTMVAPLATAPAVATLRVALIDPEPRRPLDVEPAHAPPAEPDRLLPFANGPPASALV